MDRIKRILRRGKSLYKIISGKQLNYPIQIHCEKELHGSTYGGWVICPENINNETVILSFGVGEDASFDLSLIQKYGVKIYAFDPTPKSIDWVKAQEMPEQFNFFNFGISDHDGVVKFYPPANPDHVSHSLLIRPQNISNVVEVKVYKLLTILNILSLKYIDILKMDIEGAEYKVIKDIINSGIKISQLLIEFHHDIDNIDIIETTKSIKLLNKNGYKIFNISPDEREYSFIIK